MANKVKYWLRWIETYCQAQLQLQLQLKLELSLVLVALNPATHPPTSRPGKYLLAILKAKYQRQSCSWWLVDQKNWLRHQQSTCYYYTKFKLNYWLVNNEIPKLTTLLSSLILVSVNLVPTHHQRNKKVWRSQNSTSI